MSASIEENGTAPSLKRVPDLPGGLPVLGHTMGFLKDLMGLLQRARNECGPVAGIKVLGRRIVLVTGPEGQEQVFRSPDSVFSPKAAYKLMVPIFGKGVAYDCPDDIMDEQLKMLLPALQHKRMKTYSDYITEEVADSVQQWGDKGTIGLVEYCASLTNFTSSRCLLGEEFRTEMNEEFSRIYHALERGIVPIAYLNPYLPLPVFRRRDAARTRLGEMVSQIVQKRRDSAERHEDFLQTLMESKYRDGRGLSDHEITGMLVAAMFAGHHTSSVTTAWCILEMLRHPEWMTRIRSELADVFPNGQAVDYKSLKRLTNLEWVIKEVLRLHPPLFILIRVALEDTEVLGHEIKKGTWVALSPSVAHQLEDVFADASSFCPHRFGPPRSEDKMPFSYIAFGGGRHKCLGNSFAILQIKTILAILLQRFEFGLTDDPIEPDFQALVIGPKAPARVTYKRIGPYQASAASGTTTCPRRDRVTAAIDTPQALRVDVDFDLCQGHGACEVEAPGVFEVGEDGVLNVLTESPTSKHWSQVIEAAQRCPQQAIRIQRTTPLAKANNASIGAVK